MEPENRSMWGYLCGTFTVLCLIAIGAMASTGCTIFSDGGSELGIGIRNDNFIVVYHKVDGDKVGKKASITADVDALLDLIMKLGDKEKPTGIPEDPTDESVVVEN